VILTMSCEDQPCYCDGRDWFFELVVTVLRAYVLKLVFLYFGVIVPEASFQNALV